MKYCPHCGALLEGDTVSYCSECGKALRKESHKKAPSQPKRPNPQNIGYDGYYDDVRPDDSGGAKEAFDPTLVKKISFIIIGAAFLVALSILTMQLL